VDLKPATGIFSETFTALTSGPLSDLILSHIDNASFSFQLVDEAGNLGGGGGTTNNYIYFNWNGSSYDAASAKTLSGSTFPSISSKLGSTSPVTVKLADSRSRTLPTFPATVALTTTPGAWITPRAKSAALAGAVNPGQTAAALPSMRSEANQAKTPVATQVASQETGAASSSAPASTDSLKNAAAAETVSSDSSSETLNDAAVPVKYSQGASSAGSGTTPAPEAPRTPDNSGNKLPPAVATVPSNPDGKRKYGASQEEEA